MSISMRIVSKYILKQHAVPFIFALSATTSIMLLNQIAKRFGDLVGKGLPFREAHRAAGRLVGRMAAEGRSLASAELSELRAISPLFAEDYYPVVDIERVVAAKISPGGTAPARVKEQLDLARSVLRKLGATG